MATAVIADKQQTKNILIYLGALSLIGTGAITASALGVIGSFGYYVGGLLLLAGLGGLGGLRAAGGAWKAECPSCQALITSAELDNGLQLLQEKVVRCAKCGTYVRGTDSLEVVEDGYVHATPVFEVPLPKQFQWPTGCQVCSAPATRTVHVEGKSFAGQMTDVVGGISIVSSVDVPVCDAHTQEPVWLTRTPKGAVISFRSFNVWKYFRVKNELP